MAQGADAGSSFAPVHALSPWRLEAWEGRAEPLDSALPTRVRGTESHWRGNRIRTPSARACPDRGILSARRSGVVVRCRPDQDALAYRQPVEHHCWNLALGVIL
ncbi:MAG: hypothetical protein RLZZ516_1529 [Cyanobacteriota bacterium]|jgi:hypothetical protein